MKILNLNNINPKCISNIIFDWGGVITNIDYHATVEAFEKIGHKSFNDFFTHYQDDLFKQFEKGIIESKDVFKAIRKYIGRQISDDLIERAWVAMILDTPVERIELIKKLKSKYKLFLLSNTNVVHVNYNILFLRQTQKVDFPALFHKVYYSHEIHMRKPDREIFEFVLSDSNLDPSKTLFIDDVEINTDAADKAGMVAINLTENSSIEKIFKKWGE
jgi:putative hydrolase of the HAD superfamily